MKKWILAVLLILFTIPVLATTLQSGVEVKRIPNSFYGSWRVVSQRVSTTNEAMFKQKSIDFWNISRESDVIKLENPFSGARQSVSMKDVNSKFIKFTKIGNYNGATLTDEVTITLDKDSFVGVNEIKLDKVSDIDGHVMKTERAVYNIKGEKVSGTSVGE